MPIKIGFWGGVAIIASLLVMIVSNMPTFIDLLAVAGGVVGGVMAGRKSTAWF